MRAARRRPVKERSKIRRDPEDEIDWFSFRLPKTSGSRRSIEIPPVTVDALKQHKEHHQGQIIRSSAHNRRFCPQGNTRIRRDS